MMNLRSIRFRLTAWYAGLLALLLLIFSVSTYIGLERHLASGLRESLTRRAIEMGPLLGNIVDDGTPQIAEIKSHYALESDNGFLRISRPDEKVLYVSGPTKDQSFDPRRVPFPKPANSLRVDRAEPVAGGGSLMISTFRVVGLNGSPLLMEIGASDRHIRETLNQLLLVFALALPLCLSVAIAGGYALTRRALKPIGEITSKAERISSRNLNERLPTPKSGDEVARLSLSLNGMIERLENSFHYLNRFSADASHELRTPLTILRGELELIASRHDTPEDVRDTISTALEETDRLTKITESLLVVSRLDAGEMQMDCGHLDLAGLAGSTADQMRLLADDKNISLTCELNQPVDIEGDAPRLKQVIVNLLHNAIKFTPAGGSVTVSARTENGCAVLEISDTGPGIQADSITRIFERFYRADAARTRKSGGVGLGLAIARAICKSHGGDIRVESVEGEGSRFRVELPLVTESPLGG
jgi:heavy metal sensor kinase